MSKQPKVPPRGPSVDELLRAGLQLHQSGRPGDAAAYYQRVLALQPRHAAANHLFGLVCLAGGKPATAVEHISRAVAAAPREAQYLSNLGVALKTTGQLAEAVTTLKKAIALSPSFAEAHSNLGMAYRELHRLDDAAQSYRRAIKARPGEAGFHYNLANALADAGDIVPAEDSYREALRLRPGYPAAVNAYGGLLDDLGRYDEGLALVEAPPALAAGDPLLHLRRARLLEHQGRLAEAVATYDRALAQRPGYGEALHHRANLVRHLAGDAAVAAMSALFESESAPPDDRIYAGYGLGKALADIGKHAASVDMFLRVNRLQSARAPFALERALADLKSDLVRTTDTLAAPRPADPPAIFVVGLPRSGKSTIEAILSRHPAAAAARELPTMNRLYKRMVEEHPGIALDRIPAARLERLGRDYLAESRRFTPDGVATIDTMPSNYRLIGAIRAAVPNARIIWALRDPIPHCLAIFEKYLPGIGHEYANDLDQLLPFHAAYREFAAAWQSRLPNDIQFVDVSGFALDRERHVRKLLDFCGLHWDSACLADVASEPQVPAWDAAGAAANRAAHLAAWRVARPDIEA